MGTTMDPVRVLDLHVTVNDVKFWVLHQKFFYGEFISQATIKPNYVVM
jgi:hypothetical protein